MSSSSWGCELKFIRWPILIKITLSSSSWGCELKYIAADIPEPEETSSSSWGCELKYVIVVRKIHIWRHPLREDVSWNNNRIVYLHLCSSSSWGCELKYSLFQSFSIPPCHPLREDVSWNIGDNMDQLNKIVILFVRMWVEMIYTQSKFSSLLSSSSWGCELKCEILVIVFAILDVILFVRMWVEISRTATGNHSRAVILFVRMWVEIWRDNRAIYRSTVILFVRMWVEIYCIYSLRSFLVSSSSWGCELKYTDQRNEIWKKSHPLREDVSWNIFNDSVVGVKVVILFVRMWVEMGGPRASYCPNWSSSSWGCELKFW